MVASHGGRRAKELSVSAILMRLSLFVMMLPLKHIGAPACGDRACWWRSVAARDSIGKEERHAG